MSSRVLQRMSLSNTLYLWIGYAAQPVMMVGAYLTSFVTTNKPRAPGPVYATHVAGPVEDLPEEDLDGLVAKMSKNREVLDEYTNAQRAALCRRVIPTIQASRPGALRETLKYKGAYEIGGGEEDVAYSGIAGQMRSYAETFEMYAAGKAPEPIEVNMRGDDQKALTVFPRGLYENAFFPGWKGELWLKPGATIEHEHPSKDHGPARTLFLLGAGNEAIVVATDILNYVVRENCTVICKLNHLVDYLKPSLTAALKPLIDAGFLEIISGGISTSQYLIHHPQVEVVAMTGSNITYDAIMWGGHGDIASRKANLKAQPNVSKPFFAELGSLVPVIIAPGEWSDADLDRKARELVAGKIHNAGYNCLDFQVILTAAWWPQRERFLERVRCHLEAAWMRSPWYPGAEDRAEAFRTAYPQHAELLGTGGEEEKGKRLKWTLITGLDETATKHDERCRTQEVWSGVLTETPLTTAENVPAFLEAAVRYCNERLWGDLDCALWVHPTEQAKHAAAVEKAITDLKYGCVAFNTCPHFGYFIPALTWGAMPGHSPRDIQAGTGVVHNGNMYKHIEKSVIRATWAWPGYVPFLIHNNVNGEALNGAAADFFVYPNIFNFVRGAINGLLAGSPL